MTPLMLPLVCPSIMYVKLFAPPKVGFFKLKAILMLSLRQVDPFFGDCKETTSGSGSVGSMPIGFALTTSTTFDSATTETRSAKTRDITKAVLITI